MGVPKATETPAAVPAATRVLMSVRFDTLKKGLKFVKGIFILVINAPHRAPRCISNSSCVKIISKRIIKFIHVI